MSLRHTRAKVGRMQKATSRRKTKQIRELKLAHHSPAQPNTGRQADIQFQPCMSNLWQSRTLSPRLLLQKYDNISIQKRTVSQTVYG